MSENKNELNSLKDSVIERLKGSFSNLERAIVGAKERLAVTPDVDNKVIDRISQYELVLDKQKSIADALANSFAAGDFTEVARQVNLINNLSSMIIDDAKQIITGLQQNGGIETSEPENDDFEWKDKLC